MHARFESPICPFALDQSVANEEETIAVTDLERCLSREDQGCNEKEKEETTEFASIHRQGNGDTVGRASVG
jgi:hypothetical protein